MAMRIKSTKLRAPPQGAWTDRPAEAPADPLRGEILAKWKVLGV